MRQLPHPVDRRPRPRTRPARRPSRPPAAGRTRRGRMRAHRGHEAGADRDHEQQQPDQSQLGERLQPQRVGVAHEHRQRGMLHPPGLVRAGAPADTGLVSHSSDRRCPQLPPAAAGRADQVRPGEVALDQPHVGPGRLLEGLELLDRVEGGHPDREHRDRPEREPGAWPPAAAQAELPVGVPAPGPVETRAGQARAGPAAPPRSRPRWRPAQSPSGPSTSASRASIP